MQLPAVHSKYSEKERETEGEGQSHTLKLSQFLCSIVPCVDGGSLTVTDNFCIATTTVATLASFFCCLPHVHECLSLCKAVPLTMVVLVAASATPAPFHSNPLSPPCHPASFSADSQHNELQRQKSTLVAGNPFAFIKLQSTVIRRQQQQHSPPPSSHPPPFARASCHALLAAAILQLTVSLWGMSEGGDAGA